ncbi:MAG: hypothetical protein L3J09_11190 [Flavobacteriaceae bacterium]|nr:hypothetical protein [Flavobacteriaceae bacterium]
MKNLLFALIILFSFQTKAQFGIAGVNLSNNKSQVYTITTKNGKTYTTKSYSEKTALKIKEIKFKTMDGDKKTVALSQLDKIVSTGKKDRHNFTEKYIKYSKTKSDLMTEVISGKASLYLRTQTSMGAPTGMGAPSTNTNTSFYVLKDGQSIAKYIKGNNIAYGKFKTNALKIFSDCNSLVTKIKNKDYKRKHLEDIVTFYNENCK